MIEFTNIKDAAKNLGVKVETLQKWFNRGLPYYKPTSKLIFINNTELAKWMQQYKMVAGRDSIDKTVDEILNDFS